MASRKAFTPWPMVRFGVWEVNLQSRQVRCCEVMARLCGLPADRAHLPYEAFREHVAASHRSAFDQAVFEIGGRGSPFSIDYRSARGSILLRTRGRGESLKATNGAPMAVSAVAQRVGDWRHATRGVQSMLQLGAGDSTTAPDPTSRTALVDDAPIGLGWVDSKLKLIWKNRRLAEWMQSSSKPDADSPATLAAAIKRICREALAAKRPVDAIEVTETPDDKREIRRLNVAARPAWPADGKPPGIGVWVEDVTDLHQLEARLRRSEERWRQLLPLLPVAVYTCDGGGSVVEFNAAAHKLWGWAPGADGPAPRAPSHRLRCKTRTTAPTTTDDPVAAALRSGSTNRRGVPARLERIDGTSVDVVTKVGLIRDREKAVEAAVVVLSAEADRLTGRERIRRQTRQQAAIAHLARQALRNAFGRAHDLESAAAIVARGLTLRQVSIWRFEAAGDALHLRAHIGYTVARPPAILPASPNVLPGFAMRQPKPLISSDLTVERRFTVPAFMREHNAVGAVAVPLGGGASPYGVLLAHGDRPVRLNWTDAMFAASAARVLAAAIDLNRTSTALKRTEGKFRSFLLDAPVPLMVCAEDGEILHLNRAWTRATGYTSQELPTLRQWLHLAHLQQPAGEPSLRHLKGDGVTEADVRAKSGERLTFLYRFWSLGRANDGREITAIAAMDITERLRLEAEILEAGDRERERIGEDLHDDLCQQLNAIQYMLQMLEHQIEPQSPQVAAKASEIAEHLRQAADKARRVARGFLPISAESRGLAPALREMFDTLGKIYSVRCELDVHPSTPSLTPNVAVHLYRLAQEAASNAIKHGKAKRIEARLRPVAGRRVELRVRDDGCGLPADFAARGGMGVRIMQHRARVAGGTVKVGPAPEGGTEVVATVLFADKPTDPSGTTLNHKSPKRRNP